MTRRSGPLGPLRPGKLAGLAGLVVLVGLSACVPGTFDALADAAPVTTVAVEFPFLPNAEVEVALTVPADDEGRARVLVSNHAGALGWLRLDLDGRVDRRFANFEELTELATHDQPTLSAVAINEDASVAEGLIRIEGGETLADRVVRFRVADFSRVDDPSHDMQVYPWLGDPSAELVGVLAAIELDEGLAEGFSRSSAGLLIWDELGTRIDDYAAARATLLADDPAVFDADPRQGYGLTLCPDRAATALAGGAVLPGNQRAALSLEGESVAIIAVAEPPEFSAIGAPIYDCERGSFSLPGAATTLAVVDLGLDGDDDLLVGAPDTREVWVYENLGDGLPPSPSLTLTGEDAELEFGLSVAHVELGGDAPEVIVVGAPGTRVGDKGAVGRVVVFDAADGERIRVIDDLEPVTDSRHGLAVHGLDVPGRQELAVSGARELRIHWQITADDEGRLAP